MTKASRKNMHKHNTD